MKLLKVLLLCLFSFVTLQIIAEKKASYVQNPLLLIPVVLLIVSLSSRLYLHKLFDQEKVFLRYKIFLWQKRYSCFTLCCMLN